MRSGSLEKASVDEPWAGHRFLGSMSQLARATEERTHSKGSSGLLHGVGPRAVSQVTPQELRAWVWCWAIAALNFLMILSLNW